MRVDLRAEWPGGGLDFHVLAGGPAVVVGRGTAAAVRIPDQNLSRRHCQFTMAPDGLVCEDLGSSNGTQVNGQRIQGPQRVSPGDRIQLGGGNAMVRVVSGPGASPPAGGAASTPFAPGPGAPGGAPASPFSSPSGAATGSGAPASPFAPGPGGAGGPGAGGGLFEDASGGIPELAGLTGAVGNPFASTGSAGGLAGSGNPFAAPSGAPGGAPPGGPAGPGPAPGNPVSSPSGGGGSGNPFAAPGVGSGSPGGGPGNPFAAPSPGPAPDNPFGAPGGGAGGPGGAPDNPFGAPGGGAGGPGGAPDNPFGAPGGGAGGPGGAPDNPFGAPGGGPGGPGGAPDNPFGAPGGGAGGVGAAPGHPFGAAGGGAADPGGAPGNPFGAPADAGIAAPGGGSSPAGDPPIGSLEPDLFPLGLTAVRRLEGACVLAKKQATGDQVVVKGLVGARAAVSEHLERLRALIGLRHPAIVSVLEVGELDNPAVVLEYFESRTLESFVTEHGALDWSLIPGWLETLLPGLAAACAARIPVVGLQPANVLISARGEARLTNLAGRILKTSGPGISPEELKLRELQYRAPETLDAIARPVGPRATLYSLGATMFFALTAAGPFESSLGSTRELIEAMRSGAVIRPSQARPSIPVPLSDFIMRLMARDPGKRFASADEALAELANLRRALGG